MFQKADFCGGVKIEIIEPYANIEEADRISKIEFGFRWDSLSTNQKKEVNKILWELGD